MAGCCSVPAALKIGLAQVWDREQSMLSEGISKGTGKHLYAQNKEDTEWEPAQQATPSHRAREPGCPVPISPPNPFGTEIAIQHAGRLVHVS